MTDDEIRALLETATPGPWQHVTQDAGSYDWRDRVVGADDWDVCCNTPYYPTDITRENARLIAAAPSLAAEVLRLREALRQIANAYDDCTGGPRFVEIAAAALKGAAE